MNYHLQFFFQTNKGHSHNRVSQDELASLIGNQLLSMILNKVYHRIENKSIPEVTAFFERGGRQVVAAELTSRGNVYVEIVES